jgi:hypothetical protein
MTALPSTLAAFSPSTGDAARLVPMMLVLSFVGS